MMVNQPDLESSLRSELAWEFSRNPVDLRLVRDLVSSPRLMSFGVRAFSHPGLAVAGDTYLDRLTMLADGYHKTYAMHIDYWKDIACQVEYVEHCEFREPGVMKLQVWSVDPNKLDPFAMAIAVALSYKRAELLEESRISSALNELVSRWGYFSDDF